MAAYAQSVTLASFNSIMESWSNVNDKILMEKLFTILVAEFAAAETAGLAAYTVTAGLQASLERTLDNMSNALKVEFLSRWINFIVTEFTLVEAGGLSYTRTTSSTIAFEEFVDHLNQSISYLSDSQKKIAFHAFNDLLNTEFGLMEAADT